MLSSGAWSIRCSIRSWTTSIADALKVLETKLLRCDVGALGWLLVLRRAIPA
jgi:hypothetical protein